MSETRGFGTLITHLLDEHWPNSGVNGWYLADLIRAAQLSEPQGCKVTLTTNARPGYDKERCGLPVVAHGLCRKHLDDRLRLGGAA